MCIAAGIGAAALVGGVVSAAGAKTAADQQRDSAQMAANTENNQFQQTKALEAPYVGAGNNALTQLQGVYGLPGGPNLSGSGPGSLSSILSNLPGYQFQLQQGENAMKSNLNAQGLLGSGLAQKELMQFGQGVASNYLGQYVGGLQGMAQMGQASAGQQAMIGTNVAGQIAGNQIYAGNAAASGTLGQTQAITGTLGQLGGLGGLYSAYGGLGQSSYGGMGSQIVGQQGGLSTLANGYTVNTPGYLDNMGAGGATTYAYPDYTP